MKLWEHMRRLWPRFTLAPVAPFWVWSVFWVIRGQLRWDHVAAAFLASLLAYGNATSRRLFIGLLPVGLVGLFYDAMRFVKNVGLSTSNVHLCDLRDAELRWFGLDDGGVRVTLHDWFQPRATMLLDVVCAVPYGIFLMVVVGYAIFLFIRDFPAEQRFAWGFLALNIAGFATYHLYPAAPPWYFHQHGCTVDLGAASRAGPNLLRVDNLMGIHYFAGFYGRSSDVFGAVPSLHVAYPLLMITEGWRKHKTFGRALLALFYIWMCFAAVYLDHHWVIDIVLGSLYAVVIAVASRHVMRWDRAQSSATNGAPIVSRKAAPERG